MAFCRQARWSYRLHPSSQAVWSQVHCPSRDQPLLRTRTIKWPLLYSAESCLPRHRPVQFQQQHIMIHYGISITSLHNYYIASPLACSNLKLCRFHSTLPVISILDFSPNRVQLQFQQAHGLRHFCLCGEGVKLVPAERLGPDFKVRRALAYVSVRCCSAWYVQ